MHFSQVILKTLIPLQVIEFNNKSNDHQFCFFFMLMTSQIELVNCMNVPVNLEKETGKRNTAKDANQ